MEMESSRKWKVNVHLSIYMTLIKYLLQNLGHIKLGKIHSYFKEHMNIEVKQQKLVLGAWIKAAQGMPGTEEA